MKRLLVGITVLLVLAAVPTATAGQRASSTLYGTVGPGDTIKLAAANGKAVIRLRPGRYTVIVRDKSTKHNFRITGPVNAANKATSARFVGSVKWVVMLAIGGHSYGSDAGDGALKRRFRVG